MLLFILMLLSLSSSIAFVTYSKLSTTPLRHRAAKTTSLRMAIEGPVRYSSADWIECIKSLPSSRILKRTKFNIAFFTAW